MITEIYIEDNRLDLSKDLSSEFTYAIDDIQDFAARNTGFSKTIILPGNAINNKLFGHIFEFSSSNFYDSTADNVGYNFNASKSASCVIYVDKIQVFKGIIRLLEITIDRGTIEYECVVFGELGGFVTALNNDKLEDLDFSAYNHVWNATNILASWEQASGTTASGMGYYYPLIDYGQVLTNKKHCSYKAFRPALFVKEYIDKIITNSGYTYEAPFFDTNLFKRLVIPNNQRFLSNSSDVAFSGTFTALNGDFFGSPTPRPFLSIPSIFNQGYFTPSNSFTRFTYTGAATIQIRFEFTIIGETTDRTYILINKNGTGAETFPIEQGLFSYVEQSTGYISLATNDYIEFRLDWDGWATGDDVRVETYQFDTKFRTSSTQAVPLNLNETIFINNTIPKGVFQRDFIASIIKMFNLYIVEDTTRYKHLIITPYIDFYTTTANFLQVNDLEEELLVDNLDLLLLDDYTASHLDWSTKVDRSKPFKLKPMSELNGRFFEFKYKSDVDYYNEDYAKHYAQGYADHIEDTGYEFANDKQTNEVIFSATPLLSYQNDDKVYPTIFKLTNTTSNTPTEDPIDHNIRIMQVRKITGVSSWDLKSDSGNLVNNLTYYGYGGHLDDPDAPTSDINFGVPKEIYFSLSVSYPSANLFNGFWSDYVAEITDKDSKLLTCNVYLKITDIYGLDFSKLIYIDGALWRLNKVIDYNPTNPESTKCEFLRVIELTYA
jgi:hypothetical protein